MSLTRRLHKKTARQCVEQKWECSQIEHEEEEEEDDWGKENQMGVQCDEETLERRKMEGSSLQVEVRQKEPELVVHERMTIGKEVKCTKEEKK